MTVAYKNFPPGWDHLKIPMADRRSAMAGLAMYSACRPRATLAQRALWIGVALFGPRCLPGRALHWMPLEPEPWAELLAQWRRELGPFDAMAGYQRISAARSGFAVLLMRRGEPLAFIKLRPSTEADLSLEIEERALRLMSASGPGSFSVPEVRSAGEVGGWRYFCTSALPPRIHHRPVAPPLERIIAEIERGLEDLPRPSGAPEHWRPMHGDLTPWNLRRCGRGLFLVDWEHAGWGPPGVDIIGYQVAAATLRRRQPADAWALPHGTDEAVQYWIDRTTRNAHGSDRDDAYAVVVRRLLRGMGARP